MITRFSSRCRRSGGDEQTDDQAQADDEGDGAQQGQTGNWLLFGERNRAHDFLCGEELQGWLDNGQLQRLDLAFSRDQAHKVYVQDRLREAGDEVRAWLAEGAAIYLCGSLQGMASGVDQVLRELLGELAVAELIETGRYRRDVY